MSRFLEIISIGPGASLQDFGRPGLLAYGLSRGGAADPLALWEGAALLGQSPDHAAIELVGTGVTFRASNDVRVAFSGAPMRARCEENALAWASSHAVVAGERVTLSPGKAGIYSYVHVGGGFATTPLIGARSTHFAAGLGDALVAGDTLPLGDDPGEIVGLTLDVPDRFSGGAVRVIRSMQSALFDEADLRRFAATPFTRDPRGNRMGVKLRFEGAPFAAAEQLSVLSDIIMPGDIQATGDGAPFVLLGECQTTGGYPRLATVIPTDLPRVAQARPGTTLTFDFVGRDEALDLMRADHAKRAELPKRAHPLVRDPADIADLLSYQLIDGVTAGTDDFSS
ncbi:MAG: biotin-dependent carboxyltransferase family protein [Pseudomonadota bacterium]